MKSRSKKEIKEKRSKKCQGKLPAIQAQFFYTKQIATATIIALLIIGVLSLWLMQSGLN